MDMLNEQLADIEARWHKFANTYDDFIKNNPKFKL